METILGNVVVQILVQSHFQLHSKFEATELVSEPVTQMALELINNHLISVQQKLSVKAIFFFM